MGPKFSNSAGRITVEMCKKRLPTPTAYLHGVWRARKVPTSSAKADKQCILPKLTADHGPQLIASDKSAVWRERPHTTVIHSVPRIRWLTGEKRDKPQKAAQAPVPYSESTWTPSEVASLTRKDLAAAAYDKSSGLQDPAFLLEN